MTEVPDCPRLLGPYVLLCPLAKGGMGSVYIAADLEDSTPGKLCTIKTLRVDLDQSQEYQRRFVDEAVVATLLKHPNLCTTFDAGAARGEYFLAMELIEGLSLHHLLARLGEARKSLPLEHAIWIVVSALRGLHAAHTTRQPKTNNMLGVVHRDVSPQNIMVDGFGNVKVIDFGLALSALKETQTEDAVVLGKLAYMSPEQARGEVVDASADQFAMGVILYEMLVEERYYGDMPSRAIWTVAGSGTHRPRQWERIPAELRPLLAKALSPNPRSRFASCRDFANAVEKVYGAVFADNAKTALGESLISCAVDMRERVENARQIYRQIPEELRRNVPEATMSMSIRLTEGMTPNTEFSFAGSNALRSTDSAQTLENTARTMRVSKSNPQLPTVQNARRQNLFWISVAGLTALGLLLIYLMPDNQKSTISMKERMTVSETTSGVERRETPSSNPVSPQVPAAPPQKDPFADEIPSSAQSWPETRRHAEADIALNSVDADAGTSTSHTAPEVFSREVKRKQERHITDFVPRRSRRQERRLQGWRQRLGQLADCKNACVSEQERLLKTISKYPRIDTQKTKSFLLLLNTCERACGKESR